MFPSDNNSDHENPLESLLFKRSSFFHHPQLSDHHQNPKQDDHHTPFFSNFPSPFFDEHELIMPSNPHHHHHTYPAAKPETDLIENNNINSAKTESAKRPLTPASSSKLKEKAVAGDDDHHPPSKRRNLGKRTGKKDRHSKIRTAQGIRDRRMRLSLQIARKFFDLQDMLGYDKASSTIEWLFSKSKKAIKELMTKEINKNNNDNNILMNFSVSDGKSESFLSECEVVSGVEVSSNNEVITNELGQIAKKPQKIARKPSNVNVVRESRERARARARWRTREKMMTKLGFVDQSNSSGGLINICSSNYCPNDQKLGFCNDQDFSGNYTSLLSQDVGTIEKLLGNSSLSSASNNFSPISDDKNNNNNNDTNYYYNYQSCIDPSSNLMGFLGNWELLGNGDKLNSNQLTDHVTNQVSGNVINPSSVYSAPNFPFFHQ